MQSLQLSRRQGGGGAPGRRPLADYRGRTARRISINAVVLRLRWGDRE